jgi:hypothetical protein
MVPHGRVRDQRVADEQVTAKDGAAVGGEARTRDGEVGVEIGDERLGHRSDIAAFGGIEGRGILEHELARARGAQPCQRGAATLDRLGDGRGARLQRDDDRVGIERRIRRLHADRLHAAQAALDQRVGQIRRAGEVVGHRAEQDRHRRLALEAFAGGGA